jgi:hypothetical protein
MFDVATGLNSTAPKEMSAKPISVQFSDLDLGLAVRKMFEGQKIDYIFVEGQGIMITGASQSNSAQGPASSPFPKDSSPFDQPATPFEQPVFSPDAPGGIPTPQPGFIGGGNPFNNVPNNNPAAQPAVIQTPFGPIANPRAQQGVPNNNGPLSGPGANPFSGANPFGNNGGAPNPFGNAGAPGAAGQTTPFGALPVTGGSATTPIAPIAITPLAGPAQNAPKQ